ncbi:MAG TPA: hypothetical protein VMH01_05380 [Puia sp.]|nr:hypothetical protein [Puia sp.]
MTIKEFKASLSEIKPPETISDYLKALWYDAKGDWEKSHQIVQDIETKTASRIHAYLHRKEGDIGNADYWYGRAGARRPDFSLEKEWEELCQHELHG